MTTEITPEIGMGATMCFYTDREPYTVTEILYFKSGARKGQIRAIMATKDKYTANHTEMSNAGKWNIFTDPDATPQKFIRHSNGMYYNAGHDSTPLVVGARYRYYDYGF